MQARRRVRLLQPGDVDPGDLRAGVVAVGEDVGARTVSGGQQGNPYGQGHLGRTIFAVRLLVSILGRVVFGRKVIAALFISGPGDVRKTVPAGGI